MGKTPRAFDPDTASLEELAEYAAQHWNETGNRAIEDVEQLLNLTRERPKQAGEILTLAIALSGYAGQAPVAVRIIQLEYVSWSMGRKGRKQEAQIRANLKRRLADSQMARTKLHDARRALGLSA